MRVRSLLVAALAGVAALAVAVPASAMPMPATPAAKHTVVLFLRAVGRTRAHAAQASLASLASQLGSPVLASTSVPDTVTLRATAAEARALQASPLVANVAPNLELPGPTLPTVQLGGGAHRRVTAPAGDCGTAAHPQLDPEALTAIQDVPGQTHGFDGKGVTVAYLADGIQVANPDFVRNRAFASAGSPAGSRVITSYRDFSGDGTAAATPGGEAFLDSSSIGAQGNATYDLSRFVSPAHPLPAGCDIRIVGAAPGASIMALKIFAENNATTVSGFVQAINYAVAHGASVINESFGSNGFPDTAADVVRQADDAAVAAGVTVVVSSGDAGITSTIGSPGTDPNVLTVGATTTLRAYQQDTFGGINLPGQKDRYLNGNISSFSSAGFGQDGKTVDLVAPGDLNWTLCAASHAYQECGGSRIQLTGGTSESAPLTAGAAADVIEAYRASHHGTSPSPALVGAILTSSATDLHSPAEQQGAGLLDVAAAVRLALSAPGTTESSPPGGVLASATQLDLGGEPGSTASGTVTLTNTSASAASVALGTRALQPFHSIGGAVVLDPSVHTKLPRFPVWSGAPEVYRTVALPVGLHVARIRLQAAYQFRGQTSLVHVALFSPSGQLAGYSSPQGIGDYADVEVADPASGTWTAAFFTLWDGYQPGMIGSSGRVPFTFTEERFVSLGAVTPAHLTLAGGASATVTFHEVLPSTAGDAAASIVVRAPHQSLTSIPVSVRTFVAIGTGGGRFSGVLTGGNGRAQAPGQMNTYDFVVPSGEQDLDVGLAMAQNPSAGDIPADQVIGMLVDPTGEVVAYDSNYTVVGAGVEVATRFLSLYKSQPMAGTWSLVIDWVQPGAGTTTAVPFRGSVAFNQVSVTGNLPDSASTDVPQAGTTFTIHVHDTGVAPMVLSPDARLTTTTTIALHDVHGVSATQPMPGASDEYYVPTETSSLTFTQTATLPTTFDASFAPGDPDLSPLIASPYVTESWSPSSATLTYTPPGGTSAGLWNVFSSEIGPYGAGGEPSGSATTTTTATTLAFDQAVTSPVPDTVQSLTTGGGLLPDLVGPGQSSSIPITITPTAPIGTTVSGTLFLNGLAPGSLLEETLADTSLFTSDLAVIPYTYTVSA